MMFQERVEETNSRLHLEVEIAIMGVPGREEPEDAK